MPIINRREIESFLGDYLLLAYEPPNESRVRQSHRLVNEVLMRLATAGPMRQDVGETVAVSLRLTVPTIANHSLLPKNAARACAASKWFGDIAS